MEETVYTRSSTSADYLENIKCDTTPQDFIKSKEKECLSVGTKGARHISETEDKTAFQFMSEVRNLKKGIQSLKRRNRSIRENIGRKQKLVEAIKKEIKTIDGELESPTDKILRSLFSEAQIHLLKGNLKKIYWADDDLAQAFTLRHMGGRDLYLYLKNTLNYPLPSLSCVQAWAAN